MAKEEENDKKDGEGGPNETMLATEARDPDEAVIAEDAIHAYTSYAISQAQPVVEDAIESAANWFLGQTNASDYDNMALIEAEGKVFLEQMAEIFGGHKTPVFQALFPDLDGQVDMAARGGHIYNFMMDLKNAARDSFWYLRDNLPAIMSGQWDSLRDLAYEGSTEFIPVIHKMGLPKVNQDPTQITGAFAKEAEAFKKQMPERKDQAEEKNDQKEGDEKKASEEQEMEQNKQQFNEEEASKQAL